MQDVEEDGPWKGIIEWVTKQGENPSTSEAIVKALEPLLRRTTTKTTEKPLDSNRQGCVEILQLFYSMSLSRCISLCSESSDFAI